MVRNSKESAGEQQKYRQDKKKPLSFDDCDRPACDDMVAKMQQAAAASKKQQQQQQQQEEDNCPVTSSVLGRATWTLMHTMAAWYPEKPTQQDQREMSQFMSAVARFYPCSWCAQDFQENLAKSPVQYVMPLRFLLHKALSVWKMAPFSPNAFCSSHPISSFWQNIESKRTVPMGLRAA